MTVVLCPKVYVTYIYIQKTCLHELISLKNHNLICILYFYLIFSTLVVSFYKSCDKCTGSSIKKGGSRRGQRAYQTRSGEGSTRATRLMVKGTVTFRAVTYRKIGGIPSSRWHISFNTECE